MSRATRSETVWSVDDLELELRKLPGVRAAGFQDLDDILLVQLHVADQTERINRSDRTDQPVPISASRIAARHSDRPVTVEVVRWRTLPPVSPVVAPEVGEPVAADPAAPETAEPDDAETPTDTHASVTNRTRLLAVLAFPDTDELEVHLVLDGKRTIGRAPVSLGIAGAAEATIDAVRDLGTGVHPRLVWARVLDETEPGADDQVVVAVALEGVDTRSSLHYGLASGSSLIDAAARAALDAMNRRLSREH